MEIVRDTSARPDVGSGTAVTIGAYDGVHLGHRAVIGEVRRRAADAGLRSALITFDRHPASIVRPESAPRLLCDLDQKLELLAETGLDLVVVVHFDAERASETALEFVDEVIVGCVQAREVIVGQDFHFGQGRHGNVELLRELGPSRGFTVDPVALVDLAGRPARDEEKVSSTAIRRRLVAGDVESATEMLGRPHEVRGPVMHGDKRGRELGFPTANIAVPGEILLPADGIYAGIVRLADGSRHQAAISLGRRPTFYEEQDASLLEAHLLDFAGDLYDQHVAVQFVGRLRGEERFESVEALVEQMGRDCEAARRVLAR